MARHCIEALKVVVESQEVCIALLFVGIDSKELNLTLVVIRRDLGLRGHLNEDVSIFVVLNFRKKILCLVCSNCFTFEVLVHTLT
jgi:hypothetical protein